MYGDDIVVRQSSALLLTEVLRDAGFVTNKEKTFIVGPFRESCGADWYQGQDVRPVFLTKPVTDLRHLFALHNTFLRSSSCELFSEELREYLRSFSKGQYYRPGRERGDTAFSVPLDMAMTSSTCRWNRELQSWSWTEIFSKPIKDTGEDAWCEDVIAHVKLMAMLRGSFSKAPFTLRYSSIPTRRKVCRPHSDSHEPYKETFSSKTEEFYFRASGWNNYMVNA